MWRAISGGDDPEVDVLELSLNPGDRMLVCSDGLSSVVQPSRLAELMDALTREIMHEYRRHYGV